jgi:hypothetical protein
MMNNILDSNALRAIAHRSTVKGTAETQPATAVG